MAAFGMAARRWYLLVPLMAASGGVAWFAYTQMPATYAATAVYQVSTSTASEAKAVSKNRGLTLASPKTPQDPLAVAKSAAADLVESVHPQPPAGSVPGRPNAQPVTLQLQPGTPVITVRAVADSAGHARDAVTATTTQLADRLRGIAEEQRALVNTQLSLDAVSPVAFQPPQRTVGRRVGLATLLFCLALSVLLAAAVERSARRRRLLAAQAARAEEDERDEIPVPDDDLANEPAGSPDGDRAAALVSPAAGSGPAWASGPVRTVTSARPAAPVRDDAAEDDTAVIFPGPGEPSPAPVRAPERPRSAEPRRAPEPQGALEPQRPLAAETRPRPPRVAATPARPGRAVPQGGRAPMPPRMPKDTELPVPAALSTGGNRRPTAAPTAPRAPHRPDTSVRGPRPVDPPRPTDPPRSADSFRPADPSRPGDSFRPADPSRPGDRRGPGPGRPGGSLADPSSTFGNAGGRGPGLAPGLRDPDRGSSHLGGSDLGSASALDLGTFGPTSLRSSLEPSSLEPTALEPTALESTLLGPTALEPTALEPTLLEPTLLEPASLEPSVLDSTSLDSTSLEPTSLEPALLEPTSPERTPLERTSLEPTVLEAIPADLDSREGSELLGSSPLWLPVADLPAETDGWLPSLAPDSTNVLPVHADFETSEDADVARATGDADAHEPERGTGGIDRRDSDRHDSDRADSDRADDSPADAFPADERSEDELPAGYEPADHEPADHEPADHEPADHEPANHEPGDHEHRDAEAADLQPGDGEAADPGPGRPDPGPAASAAPTGRTSARDDRGDLEGWPDFDEQVRV